MTMGADFLRELVMAAAVYAAANTPYEVPEGRPFPHVVTDVEALPDHLDARYEPSFNTILLAPGFDPEDPGDRAVLVHEMVHWLQVMTGAAEGRRYCELEREAYVVGWWYELTETNGASMRLNPGAVTAMLCTESSSRYHGSAWRRNLRE